MTPRAWIVVGWLFLVAAAVFVVIAMGRVLSGEAPVACAGLAGVSCPSGPTQALPSLPSLSGTGLITAIIWAVAAGVAFFSALASFFWAAHLRILAALRALAPAAKP